jgi:hypothetical protein
MVRRQRRTMKRTRIVTRKNNPGTTTVTMKRTRTVTRKNNPGRSNVVVNLHLFATTITRQSNYRWATMCSGSLITAGPPCVRAFLNVVFSFNYYCSSDLYRCSNVRRNGLKSNFTQPHNGYFESTRFAVPARRSCCKISFVYLSFLAISSLQPTSSSVRK